MIKINHDQKYKQFEIIYEDDCYDFTQNKTYSYSFFLSRMQENIIPREIIREAVLFITDKTKNNPKFV